MLIRQLCGISPMSSGAMWLKLLIFIFYSLVVVLERVNLVLLDSARVCQPYTTNKSYRTGGNKYWSVYNLTFVWPHKVILNHGEVFGLRKT